MMEIPESITSEFPVALVQTKVMTLMTKLMESGIKYLKKTVWAALSDKMALVQSMPPCQTVIKT